MVRDGKLELEVALRKMTSQPATIFGLPDRGRLRIGVPADLVVFDPDTVSGPADYSRLLDPRGIDYVLVNGEIVAQYGKVEAKFPGKVIRKRNESPMEKVGDPPVSSEQERVIPQPTDNKKKPRKPSQTALKAKRAKRVPIRE